MTHCLGMSGMSGMSWNVLECLECLECLQCLECSNFRYAWNVSIHVRNMAWHVTNVTLTRIVTLSYDSLYWNVWNVWNVTFAPECVACLLMWHLSYKSMSLGMLTSKSGMWHLTCNVILELWLIALECLECHLWFGMWPLSWNVTFVV